MDTPERNKIAAPPASKFEDSPVFNYINSLSPIQPVRSTHTTQSFTSLSFASLPSVFTSPHVNAHKESRFIKRHQIPDSSKPENPSEKDGKICCSDEVIDSSRLQKSLAEPQENLDAGVLIREGAVEPPMLKSDDASTSLAEKAPENPSSEGEGHQVRICQTEQGQEMTMYEWDSLISDATDLLIFNSPDNTEALKELLQRSLDRGTRFCTSLVSKCPPDDLNAVHNTLLVDPDGSVQQYGTDGPSSQPGDASEIQMDGLGNSALEQYLASNVNDKMNNEPISDLHRGMRRRCLDFEVAVAHRKNIGGSVHYKSSLLSQFEENSDQHQVDAKPRGVSLRPILPGIGLHLNALAATSKDSKILKCGTQIINLSTSDSPTATQEPLSRGRDDAEGGVQTMEDASLVSPYLLTEEFSQNIPEKKRLKLEQVSETETSCKRCNCKKSKCLKLYCECFAAGVYCIEPCSCQGCFNKPIHEATVLATRKQIESRNPLAFAPKVIHSADSVPEIGEESSKTPASARHKRGCNCKKSSCLKKYCECYQGGVGCSIDCRCEGCKNVFGRKDGCPLLGPESEQEEESELLDKNDKALQKIENQNNEHQNSTSGVPMTPLQLYRPLIQLPLSSKGKPPRSSFPAIGSTSGAYTIQKFGSSNIIRSQSKCEKKSQTGPEDEVLQENTSPGSVVKTGSPNSKRVSSSPHCNFSSSPTKRSGRKLILQSIPSFPSLTQH